ncbi:MAG TPA: PqqD family protein [Solirubrobacterales bacterium]
MSEARLRINSENVVHETIEGEVIVIDLASGSYFSLSGSAPAIWEMLAGGVTAAEAAAALEARYEADPATIGSGVEELFGKLAEARLVVEDANGNGNGNAAAAVAADGKTAFEKPAFERYTDMQDYFLLDPIHEVSPEGWPKPAE